MKKKGQIGLTYYALQHKDTRNLVIENDQVLVFNTRNDARLAKNYSEKVVKVRVNYA